MPWKHQLEAVVSWGFNKDPRRLGGEALISGCGRQRFVLGLGGQGEACQRPRHLAGCKSPKGVFGDPSKVLLGERQKCPLGTLTPFAHSVSQPSLPNGTSGIAPSVLAPSATHPPPSYEKICRGWGWGNGTVFGEDAILLAFWSRSSSCL